MTLVPFSGQVLVPPQPASGPISGCVYCVAGEIVDLLAETMAPERRISTDLASEEGSPAGSAPSATAETAAAAGSGLSTITLLPAASALGDKQVSHSPTSAPPTPWEKSLAPQMGFSRDSTPMAVGATPSRAEATSPSQQSSMAKAALPKSPTGTARQEQLTPVWLFPNQAATSTDTAAAVPHASSQGGPGTALVASGTADVATTLGGDGEVGRENSSCSEGHPGDLESPALPGTSPASSPAHSEYTSHGVGIMETWILGF